MLSIQMEGKNSPSVFDLEDSHSRWKRKMDGPVSSVLFSSSSFSNNPAWLGQVSSERDALAHSSSSGWVGPFAGLLICLSHTDLFPLLSTGLHPWMARVWNLNILQWPFYFVHFPTDLASREHCVCPGVHGRALWFTKLPSVEFSYKKKNHKWCEHTGINYL